MTDQQQALYRDVVHRHVGILNEIVVERIAMEARAQGTIDQPLVAWLSVLVQAIGDIGRSVNEWKDLSDVRPQVLNAAAIAVALIDWIDRGAPVELQA